LEPPLCSVVQLLALHDAHAILTPVAGTPSASVTDAVRVWPSAGVPLINTPPAPFTSWKLTVGESADSFSPSPSLYIALTRRLADAVVSKPTRYESPTKISAQFTPVNCCQWKTTPWFDTPSASITLAVSVLPSAALPLIKPLTITVPGWSMIQP